MTLYLKLMWHQPWFLSIHGHLDHHKSPAYTLPVGRLPITYTHLDFHSLSVYGWEGWLTILWCLYPSGNHWYWSVNVFFSCSCLKVGSWLVCFCSAPHCQLIEVTAFCNNLCHWVQHLIPRLLKWFSLYMYANNPQLFRCCWSDEKIS